VILIGVSVWSYYKYAKPEMSTTEMNMANVPNNSITQQVNIYFFNVDWCPHCVKAKTEWKKFCERRDNKQFRGYNIVCVGGVEGVNCTNSDDQNVIEYIQNYNIEHYPTLKMVKGATVIDFDGKITDDNLEAFIEGVLES
jgi:thiol-disulfide isomerase/thioredoxin